MEALQDDLSSLIKVVPTSKLLSALLLCDLASINI